MSRATVIILIIGVVSLSAATFWTLFPRGAMPVATEPAPTPEEPERRQRAKSFFSGDSERDVRSGQEMKPRW